MSNAESQKKYREKNKDVLKEKHRQYNLENKEEINKKKRIYNLKNKDKIRNSDLMRNYGINLDQFNHMVKMQNNTCPICNKPFPSSRHTVMDHDHRTEKLRQPICRKCNVILGLADDDLNILFNAIEYLKKWK